MKHLSFLFFLLLATSLSAADIVTGNGTTGTLKAASFLIEEGNWSLIPKDHAWTLDMRVDNNGASFNQWGSSILATGADPFPEQSSVKGAFQIYLQSQSNGGKLLFVTNGTAHKLDQIDYNDSFTLQIVYDGQGALAVTATDDDGHSSAGQYNCIMPSISTFSYGLPAGINISELTIDMRNADQEEEETITPAYEENPAAIKAFLDRIGGKGASLRFTTLLDTELRLNGQDRFVISTRNDMPAISGSSLSAITTGINWYLNHYAHINITWNELTTDLVNAHLPLPEQPEEHCCDAHYRYYLNYCTFGYSMTTWTWERWQQEIDWMALHGINMPLQIIGLEQVWKAFLMEDCGYSEVYAENFIPGPAYTAWWGMNNLEGWGGDKSNGFGISNDAWYERQTALAQKILARERELGMQPVLPGFSGMVPSNFTARTGLPAEATNLWCRFTRPYIMDPTSTAFATYAARYYKQLEKVMGTSRYYSMDPFHEGGTISSGAYSEGYRAVYEAMLKNCGDTTRWVIQQWQWANYQASSLTAVPKNRLIVLDLFSDGNPAFDRYDGYYPQHAIYCAIPNFGGRTGFFGRIPKMADNYFTYKNKHNTVRGIGAAPEAIEQTPVVYDLLFELPWMGQRPDCDAWMLDYALARYNGLGGDEASEAWLLLLHSALNNTTTLQGPQEAVICARPALDVKKVSSWGGTDIFYNTQDLLKAAHLLLKAGETAHAAPNYSFDIVDITRQALTDYAKQLLEATARANAAKQTELFERRRDAFLQLILDIDELLATNRMFRLGNWTETARQAATEVEGWTEKTQDWFELNNARTLITTWGDRTQAEEGGLRDYSCREWQGMLADYYYPRWQYWFANGMKTPSAGWFYTEWNWAHELNGKVGATAKGTKLKTERTYYTAAPEGDSYEVAQRLLAKYFRQLPDGSFESYLLSDTPTGIDRILYDPSASSAESSGAGSPSATNAIYYDLSGRPVSPPLRSGSHISGVPSTPLISNSGKKVLY
ncbi:MAG: alpha-N-acetylglucosaminidase [Bacteroidales bacterium]|nr:alpha-N-acetylglucosaminidase [Candidatus Physcousia equi]